MRQHPIEDPDGDAVEAQEREDRQREKGAEVIPIDRRPTVDVDRLERERAAAGPIRSTPDRLAEVIAAKRAEIVAANPGIEDAWAPRLVVAGDLVDELERQHRRAYHRRQERAARRRRMRARVDDLALMLIAIGGAVALLALAAELSGRGH